MATIFCCRVCVLNKSSAFRISTTSDIQQFVWAAVSPNVRVRNPTSASVIQPGYSNTASSSPPSKSTVNLSISERKGMNNLTRSTTFLLPIPYRLLNNNKVPSATFRRISMRKLSWPTRVCCSALVMICRCCWPSISFYLFFFFCQACSY